MKAFQGEEFENLLKEIKKEFKTVKTTLFPEEKCGDVRDSVSAPEPLTLFV